MTGKKLNRSMLSNKIDKFLKNIFSKNSEKAESIKMGPGFYFHYSSMLLNDIVSDIISDPKLENYFSWKELGDEITMLVGAGIKEHKETNDIIKLIINKIYEKPKVYFCLIPFYGINLKNPIEIGPVTLHSSKQKEEWISDNVTKKFQNQLAGSLHSDQNFATINVRAVIPAGAINQGLKFVNSIMNTFQFCFGNPNIIYNLGTGKNNKSMDDKEYLSFSDQDGLAQHPFPFVPMPLSETQIMESKFMVDYLKRIGEILKKDIDHVKTTPLERGLFNATNLIGEALMYEDENQQLINLMSAIEALVEEKVFTQGITDQVCERVAFLLGDKKQGRLNIYNKLRKLYDKRSNLSHGNSLVVTHYDVVYLWNIAFRLCIYFQDNFDRFNDTNKNEKKNLDEYLLNRRFGGRK